MIAGLTEGQATILRRILARHLCDGTVIVYGSRAMGTHTERSDIDLVIKGSSADSRVIAAIRDEIDESNFPFLADIRRFEEIVNPDLIDHIERLGKVFCEAADSGIPTRIR